LPIRRDPPSTARPSCPRPKTSWRSRRP
jgi:hypothetical protein